MGERRPTALGRTDILLTEVMFVFSHILQHFFVEGIGLRQICDWCRLIWRYNSEIDVRLLEHRLRSMRLIPKWKAFAALTVVYLGMDPQVMPLYDSASRWHRKGDMIMSLILDTGTFGHKRDMSYKEKAPFYLRLYKSFIRRNKDAFRQFLIFPSDSIRLWCKMICLGIKVTVKGNS